MVLNDVIEGPNMADGVSGAIIQKGRMIRADLRSRSWRPFRQDMIFR